MAEPVAPARSIWLLAGGSLVVATVSLFASFRLPFPAFEVALDAGAGRLLTAASVGAAVAVSGALRGDAGRPLREAYVFAISVGGAIGVAAGLKLVGGSAAATGLAVFGAAVAVALVWLTDRSRRIANFGVFLVLFALLVAATPAYMTAATEIDGFGGAALWLLGDVSRAQGTGALGVLLLTLGFLVVAAWGPRSMSSATSTILLGLSIGVAGPIAFVGSMAPALVRSTIVGASRAQQVVLAALVGAAALVFAEAAPRILIGGYAPPLNITLGFLAIPVFLWWNGRRLRKAVGPGASRAFSAVGAVSLLGLVVGLAYFVRILTLFVRNAT